MIVCASALLHEIRVVLNSKLNPKEFIEYPQLNLNSIQNQIRVVEFF